MQSKLVAALVKIGHSSINTSGECKSSLTDVSLNLFQGQITALIGPNGSGKTTLFNILGCLDAPSTGTYHLLDQEVGHASESARDDLRSRRIGLVFEKTSLVEQISLQKNVEIPLEIGGGKRYKVRALDALTYVGLANFLSYTPESVSFFQKKLACLARAIVMNPTLLLLDEPFYGLSWLETLMYIDLLQRISSNSTISILLSTREDKVTEFCNQSIYIKDGQLVEQKVTKKQLNAASEQYKLELRPSR